MITLTPTLSLEGRGSKEEAFVRGKDRVMSIIRGVLKVIFYVAEIVIAELAIVAAIVSATKTGSYADRILGAMGDIWMSVYEFFHAYAVNATFSSFMTELKSGVMVSLARMSRNLQVDPRKVLLAFIATYATYKIVPLVLKFLRKKVLCRSKSNGSGRESKGQDANRRAYDQLYRTDRDKPFSRPSN